ncbi:TPA: hypothetical protein ACT9M4_003149, partial [Legionella pneumophila]
TLVLLITINDITFAENNEIKGFIEAVLFCKKNLNQLDLAPTVLSQTGWEILPQNDYKAFQYLFHKNNYEIGFNNSLDKKNCVVRLTKMKKIPRHDVMDVFKYFKPVNGKINFCRIYGTYPFKNIEAKFSEKNLIRYHTSFNPQNKLFTLTVSMEELQSKSHEFFSLCGHWSTL